MITEEIRSMPVKERIILMEEIWDSLACEESGLESPEWHKSILDERREKINSGDAEFVSLDALKEKN